MKFSIVISSTLFVFCQQSQVDAARQDLAFYQSLLAKDRSQLKFANSFTRVYDAYKNAQKNGLDPSSPQFTSAPVVKNYNKALSDGKTVFGDQSATILGQLQTADRGKALQQIQTNIADSQRRVNSAQQALNSGLAGLPATKAKISSAQKSAQTNLDQAVADKAKQLGIKPPKFQTNREKEQFVFGG